MSLEETTTVEHKRSRIGKPSTHPQCLSCQVRTQALESISPSDVPPLSESMSEEYQNDPIPPENFYVNKLLLQCLAVNDSQVNVSAKLDLAIHDSKFSATIGTNFQLTEFLCPILRK